MARVKRVAILTDATSGFMRQALAGVAAYRHAHGGLAPVMSRISRLLGVKTKGQDPGRRAPPPREEENAFSFACGG